MNFIKESADKKPIVDTVFAIVKKAREAKEKYGEEKVVDATIGSLYDESGSLVAMKSVFDSFDSIDSKMKAAYASSFTGNSDFRSLVEKWTIGEVKLERSVIATPGGTGAVSLTMSEFLETNETVILPDIGWGSYSLMAKDKQLKAIYYQMFDGDDFNLNSIKETVNSLVGKQNRIVIVINDPCHNPTGYSMSSEQWSDLIDFLNEVSKVTPCIILNDIAYIDYSYNLESSRDYMKQFEKISDNVMVVIAMSCSKTMTSYGLRCGAAVICAKNKESVREAEIVYEKSARAIWSNVNNSAMINFSNVLSNHYKEFMDEKDYYIDLLKQRSSIFISEANKCGLPIYPYKEGFFVTVKVEDNFVKTKYHQLLMDNNIFTVEVNKGIRVAVCSLSVNKITGLAVRMKEILQEVR